MELENIEVLTKKGESHTLEFKKSTAQIKGAGETLCAFLNGSSGIVLIGISDKGKIVGQEVTESTKRLIGNTLSQLSPEPNIKVSYLNLSDKKQIIWLEAITNLASKPYTFDGKPYTRLESNTITMPREQYQRLCVDNAFHSIRWENGIVEDVAIDDLDTEEILQTIKEGLLNNRIPASTKMDDPMDVLKRLGLLINGKFTKAAIVLFAKDPFRWFPQCKIRLACFKGTDKREFIDNKQFYGSAFKIREEAMTFVTRYLPISTRIVPGKDERIDEPLFPLDALREIFSNAVCHRDYSGVEGSISLGIYSDRIEIWNPGNLPPGVTYDTLKTMRESKPRNPLIANTMYCRKIIESWGRGIETIIKLCTNAGHPEPEFFERAGGFCVRLKSKQMIGPPVIIKASERLLDGKLSILQQEILQVVKKLENAKVVDIAKALHNKVTTRTIQKNLKYLQTLGLINSAGVGRSTYWIVVKHP